MRFVIVSSLIGFIRNLVTTLISALVKTLNKWFRRVWLNESEFLHILNTTPPNSYSRCITIESALASSRNPSLKAMIKRLDEMVKSGDYGDFLKRKMSVENAVEVLTGLEPSNSALDDIERMKNELKDALNIIWTYNYLINMIETMANTPCTWEEHKDKLFRIWELYKPDEELEFVGEPPQSKQWKDLGFQYIDPCSDFRSAGLLGVEFMSYLVSTYPTESKRVLGKSVNPLPDKYFPFALVTIHAVDLAKKFCVGGPAKTHFFNTLKFLTTMRWFISKDNLADEILEDCRLEWEQTLKDHFFSFASVLFFKFIKHWENYGAKSLLDYGPAKTQFVNIMIKDLDKPNALFIGDYELEEPLDVSLFDD